MPLEKGAVCVWPIVFDRRVFYFLVFNMRGLFCEEYSRIASLDRLFLFMSGGLPLSGRN